MEDLESRNQGFIIWHRRIIDKGYDAETYMLWSYLVLLANHKDNIFHGVEIKRGQYKTGRHKLNEITGISEWKIERILTYLEKQQQIAQQKTNKFRIITVKNYDMYQKLHTKLHNKHPQSNTNNNDNNENNIYIEHFKLLWNRYPRKRGRESALKSFLRSIKNEDNIRRINLALDNYLLDIKKNNTKPEFIMYGSTWFNKWDDWVEVEDISNKKKSLAELVAERRSK